ncbi:MAG: chemotaxis protein CheW [Candidatus Zixiibacteriota bacterium]|jgi:purine-binding chemotaxis protein CheW
MEEEKKNPEGEEAPARREAVDWTALFDAMSDRAEEEKTAEILEARARALASPEDDEAADHGEVYAFFALGSEKYALSTAVVGEVVERPRVTAVPKAPPIVAGLFHRRGGVYVAVDTKHLIGLNNDAKCRDALVLTGAMSRVALLVDAVTATRNIPAAEIRPADIGGRAIAGITSDNRIVLDGGALREELLRALGGDPAGR